MEAGMVREAVVRSVGRGKTAEGCFLGEHQNLPDREAVHAVRSGDRDAFRVIVDRHKRRAYHVALAFVGDPQEALDISQAAFVKAYRNLKRFDASKPFQPWFYRILRNLCLDHIRRSRRRREVPLTEALVVDDHLMNRRDILALQRAIDALRVEQREVIILHYFEGFSYREMAGMLEKPIGTIMSTLYQARKQLRGALMGDGLGSERGN
jgi:RNA polymerase sigma-70 factor (ECF subfamily)